MSGQGDLGTVTFEDAGEYEDDRFDAIDLPDLVLRGAQFTRCSFRGAQLKEMRGESCVFSECEFNLAQLNNSVHVRSAFLNCRFENANLFQAEFRQCKLTGSVFVGAKLTAVTIVGG